MDSVSWLMYAGMLVWAGIGLCLFFLGNKQNTLAKRISRLEKSTEEA